jgi:hypothetical protein
MNNFILNILIDTFSECADGFQGLLIAFHYTIIKFLFASVKSLTIFENAY